LIYLIVNSEIVEGFLKDNPVYLFSVEVPQVFYVAKNKGGNIHKLYSKYLKNKFLTFGIRLR